MFVQYTAFFFFFFLYEMFHDPGTKVSFSELHVIILRGEIPKCVPGRKKTQYNVHKIKIKWRNEPHMLMQYTSQRKLRVLIKSLPDNIRKF